MATHDIARATWADFFGDFSKRHHGTRVTIEAVAPQTGPKAETKSVPFVGISMDAKDRGGDTIEVLTATESGDQVTHAIHGPTRVYHKTGAGVMSDEVNAEEILEITSSGEPPITYLRFYPLDDPTEQAKRRQDQTITVI